MEVHEADLDRHLSNGNEEEPDRTAPEAKDEKRKEPKDTKAKDEKAKGEKAKDDKSKSALEPGEVVSKNDYQVNQALILLKGLNLLQGRKE